MESEMQNMQNMQKTLRFVRVTKWMALIFILTNIFLYTNYYDVVFPPHRVSCLINIVTMTFVSSMTLANYYSHGAIEMNENIFNLGMVLCYSNFFIQLYFPDAITEFYIGAALALSCGYVSFISALQILGDPITNRLLYMFSAASVVLGILYVFDGPN